MQNFFQAQNKQKHRKNKSQLCFFLTLKVISFHSQT